MLQTKPVADVMPARRFPRPSLRRRLFAWLIGPVILLTLIGAGASYFTAHRFANQVYDRWISDSSVALSQLVEMRNTTVVLDLGAAAEHMVNSDQRDQIYYKVSTLDGAFVAGHRGIPAPGAVPPPGSSPLCFDGSFNGEAVRIANYHPIGMPVLVQVAETNIKRETLAREILTGMLVPMVAIVALACASLWFGVERGLEPLTTLAMELGDRSPHDPRPLDEDAIPQEVRPIALALNGLLLRVRAMLSAQRRFVADAAHQLRTPITGLKTQAELALRTDDPNAIRASLEQIVTASTRTAHLMNQLLALARAEPDAIGSDRRHLPLDFAALLREVTADWIPRALQKRIDLGYESTGPAWVSGDALMLREMAGNLIDNCIKYCPPGTVATCRVARRDRDVVLTITDDGPGVPDADRERVFERFHRVLGTDASGSGLGLAIVRRVVEEHGGHVTLDAGPAQRGTVVTVVLPATDEPAVSVS
ncbi:MAG: sensor histidine kinase N-terminal domain-containing protein [Burkholderiales bacterium]|nr:sensor histidine kinase N-terminal domain-containing protein [Burkholderiales bacterium]